MTGMAKGACGLVIISLLVAKHYDASNRGLAVSIVQTASPMSPFFLAWPLQFHHRELRLAHGRHVLRGAAVVRGSPVRVGRRAPIPTPPPRAARRASWGELPPLPAGPQHAAAVRGAVLLRLRPVPERAPGGDRVEQGLRPGRRKGCGHRLRHRRRARSPRWPSVGSPTATAAPMRWPSPTFFRGVGTLVMSLDFSNPLAFYIVVALAMGPTFGTIGVQNVMFFEMVGPRLAGLILGLSFLVHQVRLQRRTHPGERLLRRVRQLRRLFTDDEPDPAGVGRHGLHHHPLRRRPGARARTALAGWKYPVRPERSEAKSKGDDRHA